MEYEPGHDLAASYREHLRRETAAYSFALNQGQSATVALESLNNTNVSFTLYDDQGNVLGISTPGCHQLYGRAEQLRRPE